MQVTVTVSDAIVREAGVRGLPVIDFVESLIDKGMRTAQGRPVLDSAMERIRPAVPQLENTPIKSLRGALQISVISASTRFTSHSPQLRRSRTMQDGDPDVTEPYCKHGELCDRSLRCDLLLQHTYRGLLL